MTALLLIPRAMLYEIQNRKVERKRRSTATNNPNFVYNNDWEIPVVSITISLFQYLTLVKIKLSFTFQQWKRSKTYLSPHKLNKVESTTKKCKADEASEGSAVKTVKTDEEPKPDKPPKLCFDGELNFKQRKLLFFSLKKKGIIIYSSRLKFGHEMFSKDENQFQKLK